MRTKVKHIVKVVLLFSLIMCWGISIGYANKIKMENKTINFYFENNDIVANKVDELKELREDISIVGWREDSLQSVANPDLNKSVSDIKILFVKGNSSLILKSSVLFEDDLEGCLIDEGTAYKLFGSLNAIGREIKYYDRTFTVRGFHNDTKANVIMPLEKDSALSLTGITIDASNMTRMDIEEYKTQSAFKEMAIEGGIYYGFAKWISVIFPLLALLLIFIKLIISVVKVRKKPVFQMVYILIAIGLLTVFFKITNIGINIPLDMIPNKWSDFEFWGKLWSEYSEKFKYVLYMKKYGLDIYNIEVLGMTTLFSILTIILFVINIIVIKIKDIKDLLITCGVLIISSFITVLIVYSKYGFDININMIWSLYPLYLCGDYFLNYVKALNIQTSNNIIIQNQITESI